MDNLKISDILLKEDDLKTGGSHQREEQAVVSYLKKAYQLMMQSQYGEASKNAQRAALILSQIDQNGTF